MLKQSILIVVGMIIIMIGAVTSINAQDTGQWQLNDVKREIVPDPSCTPGQWRGDGKESIAISKRWRPINADVDSIINAEFQWQGIPGSMRPGDKIPVKVSLHQIANNKTGHNCWIKIYYGSTGGVELDGPDVLIGWRDEGKAASADGQLNIGWATNEGFRIRVFCNVAQDKYNVYYYYTFSKQSKPVVNNNEPNNQSHVNLARNCLAQQSSRSEWSHHKDAQGAVDGIKNGSYGFHTNYEQNPWWQVDLGQVRSLTKIVIYNRLDYERQRSRTLRILLSNNGVDWQIVYAHNGTIFGGTDGHPLSVSLQRYSARFIRLQLAEKTWFHLDEVEVY